jgi:3-oxoacyl-[acyl-carrier-protein] synthase III
MTASRGTVRGVRISGVGAEMRTDAVDQNLKASDLAARAGRKALDDANVNAATVDAVLFTGVTKDFFAPATANVVAEAVGAVTARVFDVMNACNGLIDGLDVADSLIRSGKARRVLVTTGERASIVRNGHATGVEETLGSLASFMVADGGGAVLVEATDDPDRGLLERECRSFPGQWRLAVGGRLRPPTEACDACGSVVDSGLIADAPRLLEFGRAMMPPVVAAVMERTGWRYDELDVVFCHEAQQQFAEQCVAEIHGKVWSTLARFGNTSTCSLPLAMAEAKAAGVLTRGKKILLVAGSYGMSCASMTLVW